MGTPSLAAPETPKYRGFMSFLDQIHPERRVAGFSKSDGTLLFYNFVKAALAKTSAKRVMDFGAGRGSALAKGTGWRRELQDLRQLGAEVWAADIDPIVREHPASDHQIVLTLDQPLPFEDDFFDVIVSDFTFEHVAAPGPVSAELLRVLRPGGYICARTANKFGYVALLARAVPNRLHVKALAAAQPNREAQDVFPTVYKMNSVGQITNLFKNFEIGWYRDSAGPSYYFNSPLLYRLISSLHRVLPDVLATSLCLFIRKPGP
jgi:SAM-dependent methyltransferase